MADWLELRDKYEGTCIVIANGPSLNDIPDSFLNRYPSFGTNRIYLRKPFVCSFHVITNQLIIDMDNEAILRYPAQLTILPDTAPDLYAHCLLFHKLKHGDRLDWFSKNVRKGIVEGYTVTHVCLQLAYWFGFSRVLLVGLDHHYKTANHPNQKQVFGMTKDPDHFSSEYFKKDTIWQTPDLVKSERSYRYALKAYQEDGREIINCSSKTRCDIFPKESWKKYA